MKKDEEEGMEGAEEKKKVKKKRRKSSKRKAKGKKKHQGKDAGKIEQDRRAEIEASRQGERKEGRRTEEKRSTLSKIKGEGFLKFLYRKEASRTLLTLLAGNISGWKRLRANRTASNRSFLQCNFFIPCARNMRA